jgi:hypothetical protein
VVSEAPPCRLDLAWEPVAGATGYDVFMMGAFLKTVPAGPCWTLLGNIPKATTMKFQVRARRSAPGAATELGPLSAAVYRKTLD